MSDKLDKNIESLFKQSFDNFEELPTKDLWASISNQIPVFDASTAAIGTQAPIAAKVSSSILSIKAALITGAAISGVVGSIAIYNSFRNNQTNSIPNATKTENIVSDTLIENIETKTVITKNTFEASDTPLEKPENEIVNTKNISAIPTSTKTENQNQATKMDTISMKKNPVLEDTLHKKPITTEKNNQTETPKKESFFEKNAKKIKDSTRSVFAPE